MGGLVALKEQSISSVFNGSNSYLDEVIGNLDTPQEMLEMLEKGLTHIQAIPAGTILGLAQNIDGSLASSFNNLVPPGIDLSRALDNLKDKIAPHLFDDAQLDREEIIDVLSKIGHEINSHEVESNLTQAASDMLERLGVTDADGTIAEGLAKASVAGSIGAQSIGLQVKMGSLSDEFTNARENNSQSLGDQDMGAHQEKTIIESQTHYQ